jgi:hypothetical protein
MCDRALTGPTAEELAKHFTVLNYDHRGRGDSGDTGPYAVELFFTSVGMPREMVGGMRQTPRWAELEAMAPTLAYDSEIMGDSAGGTVPAELAGRVSTETLVLVGGATPAWTIDIGRQVADALPNGQHHILEG